MKPMTLSPIVLLLSVLVIPGASAQAPADFPGHWQGVIETPRGPLAFEADIVQTADGRFAGTIDLPGEHIKGLPLARVERDGASLVFAARSDQVLTGALSPDGKSMSGTFTVREGSVPFSASRTGDAHVEPRPAIPAVGKELEGRWIATIEAGGTQHLVLTLANEPDGTVAGSVVNVDEGGVTVPVSGISQTGSVITLELKAIDASYTATLSPDGTELSGTLAQAGVRMPMTFRRER